MAEKNELVIKINGNLKGYQDALKVASKETEELQGTLNSIAKTGAIAFAGFGAAILLSAREAGKFETIGTQFEVLTGSVEEAQKTIKNLSDFAAKTPFQFPDIARAAKQLLAFKIQGDELPETLQRIGDVAAATGARFGELSLIFGQVKAAGKLTGERLLQLEERAIPIGPALAKTMGVAESAIRDLVSKGEVSFKTFEKAFATLSEKGGLAFEGMAKNSKTFEGQLSTLADNFSLVTAEVGKNFLPILKQLTAAFINVLEFIRENPGLTDFIAKMLVAGTVTGALLTTVAIGATIFLKLRASMIASAIATRGLSFAVKGLIGATGLGLIVAFMPEIIQAFKFAFDTATAIFKGFGQNIADLAEGLGTILIGLFAFDTKTLTLGIEQFKKAFSGAADTIVTNFEKINESSDKETDGIKKNLSEQEKAAKESADKIAATNKTALDKKSRTLLDENIVITAQLAGIEKEQIEFLKRRQALIIKETEANIIQDKTRKQFALQNVRLLNQQLVKEEKESAEKRIQIAEDKDDKDKEIADKKIEREAKEEERGQQRINQLFKENESIKAAQEGLSQQEIEFLEKRQALQDEDSEVRNIKNEEERDLAIENLRLKNEQLLTQEAEFFLQRDTLKAEQEEKDAELQEELTQLSIEQREALNEEDLQALRDSLQTKAEIEAEAAKQRLLANRKEKALFAADEKKFGQTIAQINSFFRSEEVKGAASTINTLAQLQQSGSEGLKAIGKASALAQIAINTAKGALAALSSFAFLGPVGVGLGQAAAAAIVAFGAEKAAKVVSAQRGGVVGGTGSGDTQPFLLEPNELIVPRQNFEETITAVSNQRAAQAEVEEGTAEVETEGNIQEIIIGFDGEEAADVLTVKQNEQRFLGVSQEVA